MGGTESEIRFEFIMDVMGDAKFILKLPTAEINLEHANRMWSLIHEISQALKSAGFEEPAKPDPV